MKKNPYNIWNNFFIDFFRNLAESNRKCVNEVCDTDKKKIFQELYNYYKKSKL